ncbi:MAG TPA: ATP-binding cassette domain-containing protein [Solirubrobacteraceae bacterium]|nr:ATP-binding cassette domain-containing protein [Solirubrobacteraceae bacterium]
MLTTVGVHAPLLSGLVSVSASSERNVEETAEGPNTDGVAYAIHVEGLTKVYPGPVTAVDHLDMAVRAGEIFGLLGPNGAGKTTTVGMLTTRIVPTAGTARVGGVDVVADPARGREACGVVSQGNTLDRGLSVRDNLYFHGRYFGMGRGEARAAADRWLETFQLSHRAKAHVGALSGGMARRLMVARAVLHGPRVLFLDEPTAGLDPQSRLGLWDAVTEMHAAGQTVLLTTHYMEEADQFCDRVAIMDHGHILALDTPKNLKAAPAQGASITLKGSGETARLERLVQRIDGVTLAAPADGTLRVHVSAPDGALPRVIATADRCGFTLADVSVEQPTLETVFIELTGRALRE